MSKLSPIGSMVAIGGTTGMVGLVWENYKPTEKTILASKTGKPLLLKRCTIYSIISSSSKTVKKEEESDFSQKVTDAYSWARISQECLRKEKVYVANRGGWAYHDSDQGLEWTVVSTSKSS
ncbi:hypothetical protein MHC_01565 [Mycoplasma haemocanis str. Illinois]|uniref:Uncharacterized protein n=1 Tax=Mycoplasma haemocanis (strain Illinois) TaxID=1111676 RepID=H6N6A7_MYCHN|nr:hypothetical protein [Mycoplasma haemocanis]AEW45179.1 hypothetical protein MHC_01565 [Mycoplasma haemocanis str. Illinois]